MSAGGGALTEEIRRLIGRRYPGFVYRSGAEIGNREVPVFVFHRIVEDLFEQLLSYLNENGYRTVDCDEYVDWLTGKRSIPRRSVLLAIDDGHASIWQYGYPLLKQYGCRATVFLIVGYVRERPRYFPHAGRNVAGKPTAADVRSREMGYYDLVYWEEIEEMQRSNCLDFQSHGLYHHQVFDGPELIGFFDPSSGTSFFDWVLPHGFEDRVEADTIAEYAGMPLFRHRSYFESRRRFLDDPQIRETLLERVRDLGGRQFVEDDPGAPAALKRLYEEISRGHSRGTMQAAEETMAEIQRELEQSREILEARLEKPVQHFCFPFSLYCEPVLELVRQAGYRSSFIGSHPKRRCNLRGTDPYTTVRLNNDYLRCLPGRGRRGLARVLADKLNHRLTGSKVS